jgi:sugar lactone lactonase YvrE
MRGVELSVCALLLAGSAQPERVTVVAGFDVPESARYDPGRDLYFVSNVTGHPAEEDGNGFISLMDPDGKIQRLRWIDGRSPGVTLNAPKGMAIVGDTLWVADITVVRGFDRHTAAPTGHIDLGSLGAVFLNDVAAAPGGGLLVSDTGFVFRDGRASLTGPQRVYAISAAGDPSVLIDDDTLEAPNGVFYDEPNQRLLVASFNGKHVFAWTQERGLSVAATGPGGYDGIERAADGRVLVSSQDGRSILVMDGDTLVPLITGIAGAADLGIDLRRRRVAIPKPDANVVELWQIP